MITVINFKTIIKYLLFAVVLFTILSCAKYFSSTTTQISKLESDILSGIDNYSLVSCLDETLPDIQGKKEKKLREFATTTRNSSVKRLLGVELPLLDSLEDVEDYTTPPPEEVDGISTSTSPEVDLAKTDVQTQEIKENNITATYTNDASGVKIKNQSKCELTQEILTPDFELTNKKDLILFHTHTCESYTPTPDYNYEMTGTYRTTDLNYSVSRVGDELETQLTSYGFSVTHDKTLHDYPAYSGSYNRSYETVNRLLQTNSTTQMVIDLHRDAIGSNNNYAPCVKIGEETVAQLMFVIGTNGGGLEHPNWQQNLKFAIKIQQKANELYPGLFRPIVLRDSRYNQQLTSAATIIEVGATGNTMDQCLLSMKYLAKIINEVEK